jgi:hypothetical protein
LPTKAQSVPRGATIVIGSEKGEGNAGYHKANAP